MLFHDDVVTDREPEPGALSGSFCREEWIELPCPHLLNAERRRLAVLVQFPLLPPRRWRYSGLRQRHTPACNLRTRQQVRYANT